MIKSLVFNLTRPSVPIFIRGSTRSVAPSTSDDNDATTGDEDGTNSRNSTRSSGDSGDSSSCHWMSSNLEFPIRRIYCVGRNYRDHAIEMGGNPEREEAPFFFQKPSDAVQVCYRNRGGGDANSIICNNNTSSSTTPTASEITIAIPYPSNTSSLHYEGEFIVAIGKDGSRIPLEHAVDHIYGYAIGCDLTRRDLQTEAKKSGRPWDSSKGFDYSCPISPIIRKEDIHPLLSEDNVLKEIEQYELTLKVNDTIRQRSTLGSMIYSTSEIISNLSKLFRLRQGDIILTGTPAGVSQLNVGDVVSITCGELIPCEFVVGEPE
jgi:fumarylpyruvate hydrolase